jgi:hypothetical protein
MAGRITFDPATESFTYALRVPMDLENGVRMPTVKIADCAVQQFADSFKGITTASIDLLIRQLSVMTGIAVGVVGRIKSKDFNVLQALMGFFG